MISSMNSYGGLSANQLLSLFGAKPGASSTGASMGAATAAASIGSSTLVLTDPAGAIKQILAHAQMTASSALTLGGADSEATTSPVAAVAPTSLQLGSPDLAAGYSTSATSTIAHEWTDTLGGLPVSSGIAVSNLSTASGTAGAFHFDLSFATQSLSIDVAVAGIGPLTQMGGESNFSAGNGNSAVMLSAGIDWNQMGISSEIMVRGLSSEQAHQLVSAFESATALPGQTTTSSDYASPDGYSTQFNSGMTDGSGSYVGFGVFADYGDDSGSQATT